MNSYRPSSSTLCDSRSRMRGLVFRDLIDRPGFLPETPKRSGCREERRCFWDVKHRSCFQMTSGSDTADQDAKKFASKLSADGKIATSAVTTVSTFLRQLAGGDPVVRLKARLNAASDSYPI